MNRKIDTWSPMEGQRQLPSRFCKGRGSYRVAFVRAGADLWSRMVGQGLFPSRFYKGRCSIQIATVQAGAIFKSLF